jgi:hypothetical protein
MIRRYKDRNSFTSTRYLYLSDPLVQQWYIINKNEETKIRADGVFVNAIAGRRQFDVAWVDVDRRIIGLGRTGGLIRGVTSPYRLAQRE